MLEHDLVRRLLQGETRPVGFGLGCRPVVENELIVDKHAVVASVFPRGCHKNVVRARALGKVITGPALRTRVSDKVERDCAVKFTCGSVRVTVGAPSSSSFAKYSAVSPGAPSFGAVRNSVAS